MFGVVPKPLWTERHPADAGNRIELLTRTLLYRHGERAVIIDPGIGAVWDERFIERYAVDCRQSQADAALAAEGLSPESITDVFLTHLHFDHIGGCFRRAPSGALELRYPRAVHHVSERQWDWAQQPSAKDRGSYIPEQLTALAASSLLRLHAPGGEGLPGLESFQVEGHTPGQQLCRIRIGDRCWVYGGDLFALRDHLRLPWIMAYDLEPLETIKAKESVLADHLANGEFLIFGHDAHLVGGRIPPIDGKPAALDDVVSETGGATCFFP